MASLNQCNFIGNVGDIETRYMPNGEAVTNLSLACNENWKDKDGNKQEKTEWVRVVMYKKLAEIAKEYVHKGDPLFVSGRYTTRKWEKDGVTRYSTEIVADQMQMLGGKRGDQSQGNSEYESAQNNSPSNAKPAPSMDDFDGDIPFMNPYKFNWRSI